MDLILYYTLVGLYCPDKIEAINRNVPWIQYFNNTYTCVLQDLNTTFFCNNRQK